MRTGKYIFIGSGRFFCLEKEGEKGLSCRDRALAAGKQYDIVTTVNDPDIVLVGFDRELTYQKLEKACMFLDNGAEFIATNPDLLYPVKNGRYIPDCGSICQMLTVATGKKPFYIGKPNRYIIDLLIEKTGTSPEKTVLIGDRLYTDIAAGINAGIASVLVLSGETDMQMLSESPHKPDMVARSVKDLIELL